MKRKTKRGLGIGSKWNKRYFTVEAIDSKDGNSNSGEYAVCYYHSEHDALTLDCFKGLRIQRIIHFSSN